MHSHTSIYTVMYIYTHRFTLQEGAQGVAKLKSMHKWCPNRHKIVKERNGNLKTTILTHAGLETIGK